MIGTLATMPWICRWCTNNYYRKVVPFDNGRSRHVCLIEYTGAFNGQYWATRYRDPGWQKDV